ncbi:hypothetical protein DVH24_025838 [Malus domestica]|uniref:Large ribosomal subunit protein uL2 C-terminal domain-containing protein n=1 Tax=Malus domestica TaxID=3750 RepID=A0A498KM31_MALDO|nr:hypothetical protein DVH24_025838 [Malus domestica]
MDFVIFHYSGRIPEAALMARSYLPSKVSERVSIWRNELNKVNKKAAKSLADPQECPNLFEDWQVSLALEFKDAENRGIYPPVDTYCGKKANLVVGNVLPLRSIPEGAVVCNVKHHVGDRGTLARASGDYAVVINHNPDNDTSSIFCFLC